MAMVADARAFGSQTKRTMRKEHQTTLADIVASGLLLALVVTVVVLLLLHVGNRQI